MNALVENIRMECSKCKRRTEHSLTYDGRIATCTICGYQVRRDIREDYDDYVRAFCRTCKKKVLQRLTGDKRIATCTICGRQFPFNP